MEKNKIYISKLIKKEEVNEVDSMDITINKVEIIKSTMDLIIYMESSSLINNNLFHKLQNIIGKKFIDFNTTLSFKYNVKGSILDRIRFYEENLLEIIKDKKGIVTNYDESKEYSTYIVFDIETTGLSPINDMITEIGAVKIVNGEIIGTYSQLINPERPIPELITNLTGITDDMVKDKPTIGEIITDFKDFIGEDVLVAHNASFDTGFIREKMKKYNMDLNNPVLDTLELSRAVFPSLKSHKLNIIAKHLDVTLLNHHRAVDDATATAEILLKILNMLEEKI